MKTTNLIVLILVLVLGYFLFFKKSRIYDGFCNPDEVRVSGSCRKTCLQGGYNSGTKGCY